MSAKDSQLSVLVVVMAGNSAGVYFQLGCRYLHKNFTQC